MEGHDFSAYQVAEMAMGVEEAGASFYERLAAVAEDETLKDIFIALAKAELSHREQFRGIADSFRNDDRNEYAVDLCLLMKNYIDSLKAAAFTLQSFSKNPTRIHDAIDIAIHTEQEAIRIFTGMHNAFIERFRGVLSAIIEEEKKHLAIVGDIKTRLQE